MHSSARSATLVRPMLEEREFIRPLVIATAMLIFVTLFVLYLVSSLNGLLVYPYLSISHTFSADPGRAIAAYLAPLIGFMVTIAAVSRLNRLAPYCYRRTDYWLWWFMVAFLVLFFIGICAVAAVPLTTLDSLHAVAAFLLFLGGIGVLLISTVLDYRLDLHRSKFVRIYRLVVTIAGVIAAIAFAITVELSIAAEGILEIILVILFALYLLSWADPSEFPLRSKSVPPSIPPNLLYSSNPPVA